ncbi:MAG: tRNA preQ1(34) S-adenosylmethionine ribosyltransferase-isomerase QueA [Candidatus Omnitrophica bacterium]|nr:tRNA preQ1(34) S-adenosylmethionine ribosyltransferase-isomerase QueA [Candidatus Omnitrophota bacterium]
MKLSDFDYNLPKELIAQFPLKKRHKARMLVVDRKTTVIQHSIFEQIINYLQPSDVVVINDSKVLNCRLVGRRVTGGIVEVFLLRRIKEDSNQAYFQALIHPARVKIGERITFSKNISCIRTGQKEVLFNTKQIKRIYSIGQVPLPPYIRRAPTFLDKCYYQTVYAKKEGSVAAPTAGLHFSQNLLKDIRKKVNIVSITLHIGLGTFKPVKTEDITQHQMDSEYYEIPQQTLDILNQVRQRKGRIFAVGTTSCRCLESFANSGQREGWTDLFIYPGYRFKMTDCLLTNFHLPKTTLFMLVCAFCSTELAKKAYQEAIKEKYRFYSYGDAMLIL